MPFLLRNTSGHVLPPLILQKFVPQAFLAGKEITVSCPSQWRHVTNIPDVVYGVHCWTIPSKPQKAPALATLSA